MARLGDVFAVQIHGEWGNDCAENEVGTKVLRTTNFSSEGIINYNNIVTRSISPTKIEQKRLQYGDIILEKSGGTDKTPVGRVVFCDDAIEQDTYLCNNFTQAMRVNKDIAIPKYVFYFMLQMHASGKTDLLQNKTTGIRNLQVKLYLKEEIPLPPMEEQKKIAAVLDKVSDLIAKRRRQLDKLDLLVKARFVERFGEPGTKKSGLQYVPLDNICLVNPKKNQESKLKDGLQVSFVPMSFVTETGDIDASCVKDYNEVKTGFTYFAENDVLFAKITPCMENGKGAIAKNLKNGIGFGSTEFHVLRPIDKKSDPYWLYILTSFKQFRDDAASNMTGSAGQRRVPASFLEKYLVSVPPFELQKQFSIFVQYTEQTKTSISHSLETLETLKKSLMQEYFG